MKFVPDILSILYSNTNLSTGAGYCSLSTIIHFWCLHMMIKLLLNLPINNTLGEFITISVQKQQQRLCKVRRNSEILSKDLREGR